MVMVLPLNVAILQLRSWSPLRTWYSVAMTFQDALAAVVLTEHSFALSVTQHNLI